MNNTPLPYKALHALAIVSQTRSLSDAANSMCITQSAVSHQIKNLESFLGCKLIYRSGNQTLLTDEGTALANATKQGFSQINNAIDLLTKSANNQLSVGVYSAFAIHKLMPELAGFIEKNSDIDLKIRMINWGDNPTELGLDVVLTDHPIADISYQSICLKQELFYPVISQKKFKKALSLKDLIADDDFRLLDLSGHNTWEHWFEKHQEDFLTVQNKLEFCNTILLLQAIQNNLGAGFVGESLIDKQLNSGELVKLSNSPLKFSDEGYYFAYHKKRSSDANVGKIRQWLMSLLND